MNEKIESLKGKKINIPRYGEVIFDVKQYGNGDSAIQLNSPTDGPYGVLTVNLILIETKENEIIVKTWSENEGLAKACLASGLFKDTGKRIPSGFVEAQIWEVL